jgi:hypothetical protein
MARDRDERKYNGWTNYETWVVRLWLDNEEPSYRYWTGQARHWHGRDGAACRLAEQLKKELSDASPVNEPTVYGDLMNAALEEVNWLEIAESYLDEVGEGGSAAERPQGDTVPEVADSGRRAELDGPDDEVRTEQGVTEEGNPNGDRGTRVRERVRTFRGD